MAETLCSPRDREGSISCPGCTGPLPTSGCGCSTGYTIFLRCKQATIHLDCSPCHLIGSPRIQRESRPKYDGGGSSSARTDTRRHRHRCQRRPLLDLK
ncbi:Hypothetical predicted protein [Pelobates cultripes]|uniref:Uncharacterized protein n=1 Tax=Pelobates cultripes TaxID=61616 RepID=A0AAD1WQ28_PELCU|nr:Hypothetical predicted protein [Pelobates cultripes]